MSESVYSTYEIRLRAVRAVAEGLRLGKVAEAYGIDRTTLYRWVKRYRQPGEESLQRRPGSGRPRKLQELSEAKLRELVLAPASDFGYESDLWTVGRLHSVIEEHFSLQVSKDTVWRRLREAWAS